MKKLILIILIFILSSCTIINEKSSNVNDVIENLTIFTINDLHGAIEEKDNKGFAYISGYIENYKQTYDGEVIFLASGDMLQGTAVSYLSYGSSVIESLNLASLDAFTIGNHEFDWGLDVIETFVDGSNEWNIQANYPFLGANIYEQATNQRVDWIEPYTIINKGDLSIGVIGVIGESLEGSISPSRVNDYNFIDPLPLIKNMATDLRVNKKVDSVIVLAHEGNTSFNNKIVSLTNDSLIDAVINGHTHKPYTTFETRPGYPDLPIIQSGANGDRIGKITLKINTTKKQVLSSTLTNLNVRNIADDYKANLVVRNYINDEIAKVAPIVNEVIGTAGRQLYTGDASVWAANVIKKATSADIAFINDGSFRSQAFPVYKDSDITYGSLFEMMPFDNLIKTSRIKGSYLQSFYDLTSDGMVYDSGFTSIDPNKTYLIATVDYVFDKGYNPFLKYGQDNHNTQIFIRDLLSDDIKSYTNNNQVWDPYL